MLGMSESVIPCFYIKPYDSSFIKTILFYVGLLGITLVSECDRYEFCLLDIFNSSWKHIVRRNIIICKTLMS